MFPQTFPELSREERLEMAHELPSEILTAKEGLSSSHRRLSAVQQQISKLITQINDVRPPAPLHPFITIKLPQRYIQHFTATSPTSCLPTPLFLPPNVQQAHLSYQQQLRHPSSNCPSSALVLMHPYTLTRHRHLQCSAFSPICPKRSLRSKASASWRSKNSISDWQSTMRYCNWLTVEGEEGVSELL